MIQLALFSDVHANLPALEAVLADLDHRVPGGRDDLQGVYHLGDLVGYAPWPNETVARIRAEGIPGIAGNYDSTTAAGYKHCGCQYEDPEQEALSHASYAWTREHVTAETRRWLGSLPFRMDIRPLGGHMGGPTVILIHGAPTLNTLYWTEARDDNFCRKMAERAGARPGDVVAFGHTHKPWHRVVDGIHFVNTGSVGRPKDGDPRAGYVLLGLAAPAEAEASAAPGAPENPVDVTFVRVPYDLERAMKGIRESALPDGFAAFLARGGS